MPIQDRIYIDKSDRDVINELKGENFLNFNDSHNIEIFLIAMSIGANLDMDYPVTRKESYINFKDLNEGDRTLINACAINKYKDINVISDINKVYDYVQNCAHLGFKMLYEDYKNGSVGSTEKKLLIEINELYDELIKE